MSVTAAKKSRRPFITALIVIFIWLGASGVFGPLFGSLSTVQENDNSAFLPDSLNLPRLQRSLKNLMQI